MSKGVCDNKVIEKNAVTVIGNHDQMKMVLNREFKKGGKNGKQLIRAYKEYVDTKIKCVEWAVSEGFPKEYGELLVSELKTWKKEVSYKDSDNNKLGLIVSVLAKSLQSMITQGEIGK